MKICSQASFAVVDWTRAAAKCTKMKNVFLVVKLESALQRYYKKKKLIIGRPVLKSSTQNR